MKVTRLTASSLDAELLTELSAASFFCSNEFADLWTTMGGQPVYCVAEEGGEIVALLPGVEFGRRPLRRFQSMPDGLYTRVLSCKGDDASKDVGRAILRALGGAGYVKAHITDFHGLIDPPESFVLQTCRTQVLDISSDDWAPPDRTLQSEIRKAERERVLIERFEAGRHLRSFMQLMESTEKRHGRKPHYTEQFFAALAALAAVDDRVIWYWCEHEHSPVVSHISFVEGDTALHWYVCYDKSFSFLKANQLMLYRLIGELQGRGVRRLSLGASPPDASGLIEYKAKWGGHEHRYNCYVHKSTLGRML